MKVRLTKKFAEELDGIDLSGVGVGDLLQLSRRDALLLIREGWATPFIEPVDHADDPATTSPHRWSGTRRLVRREMRPDSQETMMTKLRYALGALALATAACSPPASETTTTTPASETTTPPQAAASAVPADIAAAVSAAAPGIKITSGERDDNNNEYEVTGTMPNGDEVEFDMVQSNGAWAVLEIQRDVPWSSVPEPVRAAAAAAPNAFEPARVIESKQAADGAVVYELFPAQTQGGTGPGGPVMEVRWHEGKAALVPRAPAP
jgi:hypothetical protein